MCVVSAVMDYGRLTPIPQWTPDLYREFTKLVDAAKVFDARTGQPHCEDPAKAKLMEEIRDHLQRLSDRVAALETQVPAPAKRSRKKGV